MNLDSVNLELLRTFVAAAQQPSFAATAALRRVSVSAISQNIRGLEEQLGMHVFERVGRRVRLTPAARALAVELEAHLRAIDDAVARARGGLAQVAGRVVVGGPRSFGAHYVVPRLTSLMKREPNLQLEMRFDVPSVLERQLADGSLDFAVLVRPAELSGIAVTQVATETFVCVAAPELVSRLPEARTHGALLAWPWLVFDADRAMLGPWWRAAFGRSAQRFESPTASVASLEQLLDFAMAGVGATVLPDYLVAEHIQRGALREVASTRRPVRNPIYLAWRSGLVETGLTTAVRDALTEPEVPIGRRPRATPRP